VDITASIGELNLLTATVKHIVHKSTMGPKRVSKRNSDVEQPSNFDKKVKDLENFEKGLRKVKKTAHPKLPKYRKRHGVHDMTSVPRGRCLIIANYIFKKKNEVDRTLGLPGYVRDSEILAKVFEQLNFVVKSEENLTVDEMKTLLHEESHADLEGGLTPNAFVAVILSHGNESGICGVDFYNTDSNTNGHTENPQNELINSNNSDAPNDVSPSPSTSAITSSGQMSRKKMLTEKDIIEVLNNQNCKSLQDRPKLIFIQACNGGNSRVIIPHGLLYMYFDVKSLCNCRRGGQRSSNGQRFKAYQSGKQFISRRKGCKHWF